MKHNHRFGIAALCVALGGGLAIVAVADDTPVERGPGKKGSRGGVGVRDARSLARSIDALLAGRWAETRSNRRPADDDEFLRRVYLDLVGKIPTAAEARDFLDDQTPDKRSRLVENLLASPAYLTHATEVYRCFLRSPRLIPIFRSGR